MKKYPKTKILSNEDLKKLEDTKVKCQCGHTLYMPVQCDYAICHHCGNKIINNSREHFKYRLRNAMKKN